MHLGNLELVRGRLISGSEATFHNNFPIYKNKVAVIFQILTDTTVFSNCKSFALHVTSITSVS